MRRAAIKLVRIVNLAVLFLCFVSIVQMMIGVHMIIHNKTRIESAKLRYGSASLPISICITAQGMAVKNVDIEITSVKANIPYDD